MATNEQRAQVWEKLCALVLEVYDRNIAALVGSGITGGEIKALLKLTPGEAAAMREVATAWNCDASTATWMVDRLEQRGLVERRAKPGDRRVRAVALTPTGEETRADVRARLYAPPGWWQAVGDDDAGRLAEIINRIRPGT
jgi:DNA-binding MarR family transcriptional regulator